MELLQKLIPFLIFVLSYSFGSYLFLREPRRAVNRLFILIMLCPFFGAFIQFLGDALGRKIGEFQPDSLYLLPVLCLHFLALMGRVPLPDHQRNYYYLISVSAYLLDMFWSLYPLQYIWVAVSLLPLGRAALEGHRRLSSRFERGQFRLFLIGLTLNLIFIGWVNLLKDDPLALVRLKMISPLVLALFVGGPVIRLRLSNVWLVFRKGFAYAVALSLFLAGYFGAFWWLTRQDWLVTEVSPYAGAVTLILFAVIFQPVMESVRHFLDTSVFAHHYDTATVTEGVSRETAALFRVEELLQLLTTVLKETFRCEQLVVVDFTDGAPRPAEGGSALVYDAHEDWRRRVPVPVHLDELESETGIGSMAGQLLREGFHAAAPVGEAEELRWLILLGRKAGSADYNAEDLQLLTTLANQLAVALQKAEAFRRLEETNAKLRSTVEELRQAQQELAKQERLATIGRMAATIAHEVRNPLGVMKVSARTLAEQMPDDVRTQTLAGFINSEVDKLNRVVSDLLDFTRDPVHRFTQAEILPLVMRAVERAQVYGSVPVQVDAGECAALQMELDVEAMERVLTNLLMNAIEAADEGEVRVTLQCPEDRLILSVMDHGPGIPADLHENVFEPFFTTREGGTGLGLAISARIVANHQGRIYVDPQYSPGCRMILEIPCHQSGDSV